MRKRHLLLAAPLLIAATAPRDDVMLRETMMAGHNKARAARGLGPLVWDAALVESARTYADELAKTGILRHSSQPAGPTREGENLWSGTRGAYRFEEVIAHWVDEEKVYINAPVPNFSRTGKWTDASHYSQIMWRASMRVGCALASNTRTDFLVCRYSPAGNVIGRTAY